MSPSPRARRSPAALIAAASLLLAAHAGTEKTAGAAEELVRFNNLGIAYLAQYKPAEAEKQFRQAVALDPNYTVGHVNIGIAALSQVHYDDAIAAFTKALALDAGNVYAHFNLSMIYKLQGKTAEALEEGLKAEQVESRDPDIHYHVGSLYLTSRDFDRAIAEFEAVLKLDPNFLSAYYSLGRAYITKGDAEKGKKYIEKHRELQAGAGATPAVGLRYGEQGRYSYAMEDTGGAGPTAALAAGAVTFTDVTQASGIAFTSGTSGAIEPLRHPSASAAGEEFLRRTAGPLLAGGVAMADVDGDGAEDLFFAGAGADGKGACALYLNRGGMKFQAVSGPGAPALSGPAMSAAFGDLDGDKDPDLVVALQDRIQLFLNDGKGGFTDATAASGIQAKTSKGLLGGVSLADVDHDGDLDIFVAGFLSPATTAPTAFPNSWPGVESLLFINGSAGSLKFTESAAAAKVDHARRRATGAVFSDFDNDRDIDFALASPGDGTTVYSNMRDGTFSDLGAASGLPSNALIMGMAAADYNKDGWMDLAVTTWDGSAPRLFRNVSGEASGAGTFAVDVSAVAEMPRRNAAPQFGVAFLDIDNDGYLDLVTVSGDTAGPALFVYRNDGEGRFLDVNALTGADKTVAHGGRGLVAGDLDLDGDLDLVISNASGPPTILRNDGGNKNHWIRIAPAGLHSNRPAVGTKVEVKAGRLWQKTEVQAGSGYMSQGSLIPHFGLGSRARVDTVRLLWPGGVLQDEVQVKADAVFAVQELDRKGSSCPILYAWNGREVAFVSDFLGGSALGYRIGPGAFNFPDTDEYVKVRGDQLQPRDGTLDLRFVNQLEETIYFDRARLLAVDHPDDVEVFPDERLMPSRPYPAFRLFALKQIRPPAAAHDDAGRDLLDAVARIDRVYAGPPPPPSEAWARAFKGYAPEHHLTLDLGPVGDAGSLVLLLHGWIDYADSTSNLAAAQAGLQLVPPYLEAQDPNGGWVAVLPQMGFPAGLPKTMTVDLSGKLPRGSHVVRIGTSMRIFWDRIQVATSVAGAPSLTAIEPASARLGYRGFPALSSPDGLAPEAYDYGGDQDPVHWMRHIGAFTRYGDVKDLLTAVDDRYVITAPGDEIRLEFPAGGLPPLPSGWRRDYLLYADGFGKDMDINSARPDTITPLPFHAMASYPHPPLEGYPFGRPGLMEYLDTYNTRLITTPMPPLAPAEPH